MAGWLNNEYERWLSKKGITFDPSWHHYWNDFLSECYPERLSLSTEVKQRCKRVSEYIKEKAINICNKHDIRNEEFVETMVRKFYDWEIERNILGSIRNGLITNNPDEKIIFNETIIWYKNMPLPSFNLYDENDKKRIYFNNNKTNILSAVKEICEIEFTNIIN